MYVNSKNQLIDEKYIPIDYSAIVRKMDTSNIDKEMFKFRIKMLLITAYNVINTIIKGK